VTVTEQLDSNLDWSTFQLGSFISQQASVVFDTNAPLNTAVVTNTIDATVPTSSVSALPADSGTSFTLQWSGSDGIGSGIANYTIYVSDDGGAFTPLLSNTTQTSTTFMGQDGHTYGFYSVATDNVGNVQPTPDSAQATTFVKAIPTVAVSDNGGTFNGSAFGATATVNGQSSLESVTPTLDYELLDSQGNVIQDEGSQAPTAVGSYEVTASFAGSTDYAAASASTTFKIK
jgi:hypothetical protein